MEAVILADDLTGANDSGVQLARRGLTTSVLFKMDAQSVRGQDAIVLNTDSRACTSQEAYSRVVEAAQFLRLLPAEFIYKKIDSTLRGNIGAELDAMDDVFQPEFIIIAPAYPDNGRTTTEGIHYLYGQPVHETDIGADKKTPVTTSYIPELLAQQTKKAVALISITELRAGKCGVVKRLDALLSEGVRYVVSDAECEADLYILVEGVRESGYRVVWAGSAGLAKCLPVGAVYLQPMAEPILHKDSNSRQNLPVLVVVGSITARSHVQLQALLASKETVGIELQSKRLVQKSEWREREIRRACERGLDALHSGHHVVLHVPTNESVITDTIKVGLAHYHDIVEISNSIAGAIGEVVSNLLHTGDWAGVVMTGGDTATQICKQLGTERFELIDEVESGVPIGLLCGGLELHAVTKAGNFGTDAVLLNSVTMLKELL